jgi:hypothetical protein
MQIGVCTTFKIALYLFLWIDRKNACKDWSVDSILVSRFDCKVNMVLHTMDPLHMTVGRYVGKY